MQDLIDRLRTYASTRKGELAELITEAADALERQTCEDAVSRQQAIDVFKKELTTGEQKGNYVTICSAVSFEGAKQILEALPSVQPQPIVRCEDCKYWMPYDWMFSEIWRSQNINDYSEDEIGCQYCDMTMKADDFCSRAERRTDEQ